MNAPAPSPRPGGGGGPQGLAPAPHPTSRAGRGRGRQAALGNSPTTGTAMLRYGLRRHLQRYLGRGEHRAGMCGRFIAPGSAVSIRRAPDGAAHYTGLAVCGNLPVCPVCSAKIRHGRGQEIARAAEAHQRRGGGLLFVTLTAPHNRSMSLEDCWDLIRHAFREIVRGRHRATLRERFGVQGFIRATEVTHGRNGWHVHQHLLVFVDAPWGDLERVTDLWRWIHERWARRIEAHGGRPPSLARGVQVIPCRDDNAALAAYLASVNGGIAAEVARDDGKSARAPGSRTPMQILADHADREDPADWAVWMEWVRGSLGRRIIEWSTGLRVVMLGTEDGPTDDDLVAEVDHAETVVDVARDAWAVLIGIGADVHVLATITDGGIAGLLASLSRWALPLRLDWCGRAGPPVLRRAVAGRVPLVTQRHPRSRSGPRLVTSCHQRRTPLNHNTLCAPSGGVSSP